MRTYDELVVLHDEILDGLIKVEVIKSEFEEFADAEQDIKADISRSYTIKELRSRVSGGWSDDKKSQWVERYFERIMGIFAIGDSRLIKQIDFSKSSMQRLREEVMAQSQEDIDKAVADHKKNAERRKKQREERAAFTKKALNNPETLKEFQFFLKIKDIKELSVEQLRAYDELIGTKTLEKKQEEAKDKAILRKVELNGVEMTVQKGYHSKKKFDLWIVKLDTRVGQDAYRELNGKARALGGWYSRYSRDGAIPGFQFKTEEAANKFMSLKEGDVSREEQVSEKYENRKNKNAARLLTLADNWEKKGKEVLSRDRKTNTARRARMASNVEGDAEGKIFFANIIRNVANAIESGDTKFLINIDSAAQLNTLSDVYRAAYGKRIQATGYKTDNRPSASIEEDIIFVEYPYPNFHKNRMNSYVNEIKDKKGYILLAKKLRKKLNRIPSNEWRFDYEGISIKDLEKLAAGLKCNYDKDDVKSQLQTMSRLKRMGVVNLPTLRAAVREYREYVENTTGLSPEEEQAKKIKELERKFAGRKIPGFFPTPPQLIDEILDMVEVEEGDVIYEPSAGLGHIADAIREKYPNNTLHVSEIYSSLAEVLKEKGHTLVCANFLECNDKKYDVIIMNPPFEADQDIQHVLHAYELLQPGGRLVAIMANNKQSDRGELKRKFKTFLKETDAYVLDNPVGSFRSAFRPTGVNTITVSIEKDGSIAETQAVAALAEEVDETAIEEATSYLLFDEPATQKIGYYERFVFDEDKYVQYHEVEEDMEKVCDLISNDLSVAEETIKGNVQQIQTYFQQFKDDKSAAPSIKDAEHHLNEYLSTVDNDLRLLEALQLLMCQEPEVQTVDLDWKDIPSKLSYLNPAVLASIKVGFFDVEEGKDNDQWSNVFRLAKQNQADGVRTYVGIPSVMVEKVALPKHLYIAHDPVYLQAIMQQDGVMMGAIRWYDEKGKELEQRAYEAMDGFYFDDDYKDFLLAELDVLYGRKFGQDKILLERVVVADVGKIGSAGIAIEPNEAYLFTADEIIDKVFREGMDYLYSDDRLKTVVGQLAAFDEFKGEEDDRFREKYYKTIKDSIRKDHDDIVVKRMLRGQDVPLKVIESEDDYKELVNFIQNREKEVSIYQYDTDLFFPPKRGGKYNKSEWSQIESILYEVINYAHKNTDEARRNPSSNMRYLYEAIHPYDFFYKNVVNKYLKNNGNSYWYVTGMLRDRLKLLFDGHFFKKDFELKENRTLDKINAFYMSKMPEVVKDTNDLMALFNDLEMWLTDDIAVFVERYKFHRANNYFYLYRELSDYIERKFLRKLNMPNWYNEEAIGKDIYNKLSYGNRSNISLDKLIRATMDGEITTDELIGLAESEKLRGIKEQLEQYNRNKVALKPVLEVLFKYLIEKGWKCTTTNINRAFTNEKVKARVDDVKINIDNFSPYLSYRGIDKQKKWEYDFCNPLKNTLAYEYQLHYDNTAQEVEALMMKRKDIDQYADYRQTLKWYGKAIGPMTLEQVKEKYFDAPKIEKTKPVVKEAAKDQEIWKKTRKEYVEIFQEKYRKESASQSAWRTPSEAHKKRLAKISHEIRVARSRHYDIVKKAVAEGKDVPKRVLADYEDLQPQPISVTPKPTGATKIFTLQEAYEDIAKSLIAKDKTYIDKLLEVKRGVDARTTGDYLYLAQLSKLGNKIMPLLKNRGVTDIGHLLPSQIGEALLEAIEKIHTPTATVQEIVAKEAGAITNIKERVEKRLRDAEKTKQYKDSENRKKGAIKEKRAYDIISFQNLSDIEDDPVYAQKIVSKDRVFPEIDVAAEKAKGVSAGAAYWKVQLRKSMKARPFDSADARRVFVKGIEALQAAWAEATTLEEVVKIGVDFISPKGAANYIGDLDGLSGYNAISKMNSYVIKRKLKGIFGVQFLNLVITKSDSARQKYTKASIYEGFTAAQQQEIVNDKLASYKRGIANYEKGIKETTNERTKTSYAYYIERNKGFIQKLEAGEVSDLLRPWQIERENDWSWTIDKPKEQGAATERTKYRINTKNPLTHIIRKGGIELPYINATNIDNVFTKKVGFFSIEYGNSLPDSEREQHANRFYQAIVDLEELTGLNIKKLNAYGKLGIGFATRGSSGAMATYYTGYRVINLTRRKGDGSLNHEWGHYLDDILSKVSGKKEKINGSLGIFATSNGAKDVDIALPLRAIMDRIKNGVVEVEYTFAAQNKATYRIGDKTSLDNAVAWFIKRNGRFSGSAYEKKVFGYIAHLFDQPYITVKIPFKGSQFFANSNAIGGAYWINSQELFARAWEAYIWRKMEITGVFNNYLQSNPYKNFPPNRAPYPQGEELEEFYVLFERLMKAIADNLEAKSQRVFNGKRVDEIEKVTIEDKKPKPKPKPKAEKELFETPPVAAPTVPVIATDTNVIPKAKRIRIAAAKAKALKIKLQLLALKY